MLLNDSATVNAFLQNQASAYDPAFSHDVHVDIVNTIQRGTSTLWMVDLKEGDLELPLVVKQRVQSGSAAGNPWRLASLPDVLEMTTHESRAYHHIEALFEQHAHPGIETVRVLDTLSEEEILVMSRVPGVELGQRIAQAHRLSNASCRDEVIQACSLAGEWLRVFHASSLEDQLAPDGDPLDLCGRIETLSVLPPHWANLRESISHPDVDTRTSVAHGDFWPGNVLATSEQITVLDTFAWARTSVYVDLAYFLVHLRAMQLQLYMGGLLHAESFLTLCEQSFLRGYDPEVTLHHQTLTNMCLRVLLCKWGGYVEARDRVSGPKAIQKTLQWHIRKRMLVALFSRYSK
ncbi:MAG: hypothetical protein ACI9TH_002407 [Kiritimatiellia bacterium]|jgi:hypothetical protein